MAFPASPTDGQTYSNNGTTYVYSTGLGVWDVQGASTAASGVTSVAGRTGTVVLAGADIASGTIPSTILANSTVYIGTTAVALNRGTGNLTLTGTSVDGSAATATSATTATTATNVSGGSVSGTTGAFSSTLAVTGTSTFTGATTHNGGISATSGSFSTTLGVTGAATLSSTLAVTGTSTIAALQTTSLGVGTAASGTAGEGRFTNAITAFYSDERLKTKINTIENALDKIDELTGFLYVENDLARSFGFNNSNIQTALSAQDVKRVQPEVVKPAPFDIAQRDDGTEYSKSGENYLTVDYEKLIPLLVEGIKELRKEINQLRGK